MLKVLIAYDGSPFADAAIDDLRRAGLPPNADVIVLSVADVWPNLPASCFEPDAPATGSAIVLQAQRLAQQAMADARQTAAAGRVRVAGVFPNWQVIDEACAGSPAAAIVARATSWPADLVVVGTLGRSKLGRMLLGSVSHSVVTHAPCSVRVGRMHGQTAGAAAPTGSRGIHLVVGLDGSPGRARHCARS